MTYLILTQNSPFMGLDSIRSTIQIHIYRCAPSFRIPAKWKDENFSVTLGMLYAYDMHVICDIYVIWHYNVSDNLSAITYQFVS